MKPEIRFHAAIVTLTVAVMFVALTSVRNELTSFEGRLLGVSLLLAVGSSLGFYRVIAIGVSFVMARWMPIMKWVLGPYFVRGTWIGLLWTKTGKPRIVVEHHDQSLGRLAIRGQAYRSTGELDATWFSHSAQVEPEKGLLHCFYSVNVPKKLYQVEGIGVFQFDRPAAGTGPRSMTGYGLDTDAGMELERRKREAKATGTNEELAEYSGKLIFEEYQKASDKLLPIGEAKNMAFDRYRTGVGVEPSAAPAGPLRVPQVGG